MNKKRIVGNWKMFLHFLTVSTSIVYTAISIVLVFFPLDDILGYKSDSFLCKAISLLLPLVLCALFSIGKISFYKKKKYINETQLSVNFIYGDLWEKAFPRKKQPERIVVVNVNTAFDTIVDAPSVHKSLVSTRTVHGQWLEQMKKRGFSTAQLDKMIEDSLDEQGIRPFSIVEKNRGKTRLYSRGTVAEVPCGDTLFLLVALSEFDEHNNAQCPKEELFGIVCQLLHYIGKNSQGWDVFIPLMGSGNSNTGIDDQTAVDIISLCIKLNKDNLRGSINVIIRESDRDKVSLEF